MKYAMPGKVPLNVKPCRQRKKSDVRQQKAALQGQRVCLFI